MNAVCELYPTSAYPTLEEIVSDTATHASVRLRAEHLLSAQAARVAAARAEVDAAEQAEALAAAERASVENAAHAVPDAPAEPLSHLTREIALAALEPVMPAIRQCMDSADPAQPSVRLILVVNPTGEWSAVGTSPASLQTCVAPLVRSQTMPSVTSSLRQRLTFVVSR